ncbi:MAG TPA: hypothetical protein VGO43_01535 [Pyrinomonadaceae bacterium]|jgi:hypothetical protein|nr:hypothetical protein [Pyrinomonadaceae bacterium]
MSDPIVPAWLNDLLAGIFGVTMRTKHFALFIGVLLLASVFSACGLSRSAAGDVIKNDKKFPQTKTMTFSGGMLGTGAALDNKDINGVFARALKDVGYVDSDGKLTPAGQEAAKSWKDTSYSGGILGAISSYDVEVGQRELKDVTGLSESPIPGGTSMEATFTWFWKPTGKVGEAMKLQDMVNTGEAELQKFDDGWRVTHLDFKYEH